MLGVNNHQGRVRVPLLLSVVGVVSVGLVVFGVGPSAASRPKTLPGTSASWTQYHDNGIESGLAPSVRASVSKAPVWTSAALDGQLYGEPLVDDNLVVVATENDTVYALNAKTGLVAWSTHVGAPVPASSLPCGDITPTVGITSTL